MKELKSNINDAVEKIRKTAGNFNPAVGIILGTGLGALSKEIQNAKIIPYKDIPHFPLSTVETHSGMLVLGEIEGKKTVAMSGRFHRYEGYSMEEITLPVRVMKAMGIKYLLISNAAGGMNRDYEAGDLVIIEDHINFMGDNPLIGFNDNDIGPRFPDMIESYSKDLIKIAEESAWDLKIRIKKGVYIGVTGPNLETRAEYRMMGQFADMVGMSTVPEVIAAVHSGLKVLGISVITDKCVPDLLEPADVNKIIAAAQKSEPFLTKVMKEVIKRIKI
jgi:purine-nucleoside phosphorylase